VTIFNILEYTSGNTSRKRSTVSISNNPARKLSTTSTTSIEPQTSISLPPQSPSLSLDRPSTANKSRPISAQLSAPTLSTIRGKSLAESGSNSQSPLSATSSASKLHRDLTASIHPRKSASAASSQSILPTRSSQSQKLPSKAKKETSALSNSKSPSQNSIGAKSTSSSIDILPVAAPMPPPPPPPQMSDNQTSLGSKSTISQESTSRKSSTGSLPTSLMSEILNAKSNNRLKKSGNIYVFNYPSASRYRYASTESNYRIKFSENCYNRVF
jgi:hypothetical protein